MVRQAASILLSEKTRSGDWSSASRSLVPRKIWALKPNSHLMFFVCVGRGLWHYSIDRISPEQLMAAAVLWSPAAALAESENEKRRSGEGRAMGSGGPYNAFLGCDPVPLISSKLTLPLSYFRGKASGTHHLRNWV
jgi:hypothetical protein